VTPAQTVALRRCAEADGPVKIAPATAAVLSERYHFIEPDGNRWRISDKGRGYLAAEAFERRRHERREQITTQARNWALRVMAWLEAHEFVGLPERYGKYHAAQEYAKHFAACQFDGLEPVRPEGDTSWIERDVLMAVECLRDYDKSQEEAQAKGCGVEIQYSTGPAHPKAKPEAAEPRPDGTVDLRTYRLRRGLDVDGGPAA
jgi:hypothetical protein